MAGADSTLEDRFLSWVYCDGSFDPSEAEVQALIATSSALKQHFENWLAATHPELL